MDPSFLEAGGGWFCIALLTLWLTDSIGVAVKVEREKVESN